MIRSLLLMLLLAGARPAQSACPALLDHTFRQLASEKQVHLCEAYQGKVLLVVNTASKCGFTPQYEGLEALYAKYAPEGLVVLGFPSNDFMGQEPGSESEIQEFCQLTYGIKFPMFEKTTVKEGSAHAFYQGLAAASAGQYPGWNFHKYLIGRDGGLVSSFGSRVKPDDATLISAIEGALRTEGAGSADEAGASGTAR
jgi:glutathione peroxidase